MNTFACSAKLRTMKWSIACSITSAAIWGPAVTTLAVAAPPSNDVSHKRIALEIRELKRLVSQLKHDEAQARTERDLAARLCARALKYANGGQHVTYRAGFAALLRKFEQSPEQASLLQAAAPPLDADNFIPTPKDGFAGGDVADLVKFCCQKNLAVRYGSRAQLVTAELVRDVVHAAQTQIVELDERIEGYKSQNIAHTDLIGRLLLCLAHCRHCRACYHHGYGCCGHALPTYEHPIAGLNSNAYDTLQNVKNTRGRAVDVTANHRRLKFLVPSESTPTLESTESQIAGPRKPPRS